MELLLNLIWVAISSTALLMWVHWRTHSRSRSAPEMVRGLMVLVCILALLFPVISISDDLYQMVSLAEGSRQQDVLKSPELRGIYHLAAALPIMLSVAQAPSRAITRQLDLEVPIFREQILSTTVVEKRPPPSIAIS